MPRSHQLHEGNPEMRLSNDSTHVENPLGQHNDHAVETKGHNGVSRHSNSSRLEDDCESVSSVGRIRQKANALVFGLIMCLGVGASGAFLVVGIKSALDTKEKSFQARADEIISRIEQSTGDYIAAASWIHGRCRGRNFARQEFRETYDYLKLSGLDFQSAQFYLNLTHAERPAAEEEARGYYETNYPHLNYQGFMGFNNNIGKAYLPTRGQYLEPRDVAEHYFPIHYVEPVKGNEAAVDLDILNAGPPNEVLQHCLSTGQPGISARIILVQETKDTAYGVVFMHPGFQVDSSEDPWPRDTASIVVRIPDLLLRAVEDSLDAALAVYIYDVSGKCNSTPCFLGGAKTSFDSEGSKAEAKVDFLSEIQVDKVRTTSSQHREKSIQVANKEWIVTVCVKGESDFKANLALEIIGGVVILLGSAALAAWVLMSATRMTAINKMRLHAESERSALILLNARQATKAERELNDFIAHEVRNPVAAAMSACSFVKAEVNEEEPLVSEESRAEAREDVEIIDNALRFVNDLLRNMLDMHRAANNQLKVIMAPADLLHDVLEPVQSMLPQRDLNFKVLVDCPEGMVVMTDHLRLKQVCLNLARNSVKFVSKGFIRLKAEVVKGDVNIYIDDSGPGIPPEKRQSLFSKFQESLDCLSQGTVSRIQWRHRIVVVCTISLIVFAMTNAKGIGLFLCRNLVDLMEGDIHLDENYDSGVEGSPGTRFVVNLKRGPIDTDAIHDCEASIRTEESEIQRIEELEDDTLGPELPGNLSVLFVDDDPILRKLFARTVRTVSPAWKIREASNGETALRLVEEDNFDLIFMDMYMASVEKQLLGTEAVRKLRARGIECRICGLSANDKESEFLEAGADAFCFKPFPCEVRALTQEFCRILYGNGEIPRRQ